MCAKMNLLYYYLLLNFQDYRHHHFPITRRIQTCSAFFPLFFIASSLFPFTLFLLHHHLFIFILFFITAYGKIVPVVVKVED